VHGQKGGTIALMNELEWQSVDRKQPNNKALEYVQQHYSVLRGGKKDLD
jgi:hypothetical protein